MKRIPCRPIRLRKVGADVKAFSSSIAVINEMDAIKIIVVEFSSLWWVSGWYSGSRRRVAVLLLTMLAARHTNGD